MARPISSRAIRGDGIWPAYASLAAIGYVLYGVGAVGPYLRTQLGLSDTQIGLHSSALAIGVVLAGVIAGGLDRRIGEIAVRGSAIASIAIGVVLLAAAPAVSATISGAAFIGIGAGGVLGYTNATLTKPGGEPARVHVARGNVWAMVTAFACPVMLSIGQRSGPGWWIGLLPALALLAIVAGDLGSGARLERTDAATTSGRLPRDYWLAWAFVAAAVAVEFSIVFWGATLVERRTGAPTTDATLIGALFLAGMFVGRLALSFGLGTGHHVRRPLAAGLTLAGVGATIAWASTLPSLSAVGLFGAGLGVAVLYPLGVAATLATAPGQAALAGTRLTMASGLSILVAPFALGLTADVAGVVAGWSIVVALAVAGLVLAARLPGAAGPGRPRPFERAGRHVVLVGLMGSGKTAVGELLAAHLGRRFVDSDRVIEASEHRSARNIARATGLDELHRLEADALLAALASEEPTVIAAAASTIEHARCREALLDEHGTVVWLRATPDVLARRLSGADHRPLVDDESATARAGVLEAQAHLRDPLFEQVADVMVDGADGSPAEIAERVAREFG